MGKLIQAVQYNMGHLDMVSDIVNYYCLIVKRQD